MGIKDLIDQLVDQGATHICVGPNQLKHIKRHLPDNAQKFATWTESSHNGQLSYLWGHYFDELDLALSDFYERSNMQKDK